jgi:hypothetical protein
MDLVKQSPEISQKVNGEQRIAEQIVIRGSV